MNRTKKIVSLMLAVIMCFGVFTLTGCNNNNTNKNLTPEERFAAVVNNYVKMAEESDISKLLTQLPNGGSVAVTMTSTEESMTGPMSLALKMYLNKNQYSALVDMDMGETKLNITAGTDGKKFIIATDMLDQAYGVDFSTFAEKFPTSLFGTKGSNLLGITEEDEAELLATVKEALEAYDNLAAYESTEGVPTQELIDMLLNRATLTEDKETPYLVNGEALENVTLTLTLTKEGIIKLAEDIIAKTKTEEDIKALLDEYNAAYETNYATLSEALGEVFKDYTIDESVVVVKLVLDAEQNLPYAIDVKYGKNSGVLVILGKNPEEPTEINVTVNNDGTTSKGTIKIAKAVEKHTITILDEENDGVEIELHKFNKTLTMTPIEQNNPNTAEAVQFKFELTAELMSLSIEEDGSKVDIVLKAKDTSPIKFDEYKDILSLTEEELIELSEKLEELFPSNDDEWEEDEWEDEWEDDLNSDIPVDDSDENLQDF